MMMMMMIMMIRIIKAASSDEQALAPHTLGCGAIKCPLTCYLHVML